MNPLQSDSSAKLPRIPNKPNQDDLSIITRIVSLQGKELSKWESHQLCTDLKNKKFFLESLKYADNFLRPSNKKVDSFVLNALLSRRAKSSEEWEIAKDLFSQLPKDLLSIQNLNCFIKQCNHIQ